MDTNNIHVHSFTPTVVPPTCKECGYTLFKCACGYEHKGNFKPTGNHTFQRGETTPPTCTEPGSVQLVCSVCGEIQVNTIPPHGHEYGEWSVQAFPTCTQEGRRSHQCQCCGVIEEVAIPAVGHKCVEGTSRRIDKHTMEFFCEHCGETVQVDTTKSRKVLKRILLSLLVLVLLVGGTWAVRHLALPGYHYWQAKHFAEAGDHDDALKHYRKLQKLAPDSKKLADFTVVGTGCTIETTYYDSDGSETGTQTEEYVYEYDKYGNQTSYEFYIDDNLQTRHSYEYEYDKDGRIAYRIFLDEDGEPTGKTKYEYDKDGLVKQIISYDADGEYLSKTKCEYDENGCLVTEYHYDSDEALDRKVVFRYDESNRLTKKTWYFYIDGEFFYGWQYKYEYDENGVKRKSKQYSLDENGETTLYCVATYEWDDFLIFYTPKK